MIPKIIHYTWFSNDEQPSVVKECIESWKKHLPGYELRLWDMNSIKSIESPYLKEAIAEKKWAFASDYVRIYATYNFGGIYLDTDVMVHKSFDDLINNVFFIGKESSFHIHGNGHDTLNYLSAHCFGSEAHHPYLKDCLDYFNSIHFIKSNEARLPNELKYDMTILPYIQAVFAQRYGYNWLTSITDTQCLDMNMTVYPSEYFDPKKHEQKSYCTHLALGSWREYERYNPKITFRYKIAWRIKALTEKILNKFSYTMIKLT